MVTRLTAVTLAASMAVLWSGCATKVMDTLEVAYACAPPDDAKACAPSSGTCAKYLTGWANAFLIKDDGVTDNGLYFFMQVNNQRPDNSDASAGRVNTADAFITGYELSYSAPGVSLPSFSVSAIDGLVPAGGSATPFVTLIPVEASVAMQAALPAGLTIVDVHVKMKGNYQDGSEFETGDFKVTTHVYNEAAPFMTCPNATDVITAVCPNSGQTSTWTCEAAP
jgi:hypothetical protein